MVFSSLTFIYLFLPAYLIGYFLCQSITARNRMLTVFSLLFYAWSGPKYLLVLLLMVYIGWVGAAAIERSSRHKVRQWILIITCALMLTILGYFKYADFLFRGISEWLNWYNPFAEVILPIGISFYTFQLMSYVVDVYRREVDCQDNFFDLLLYVSLFHQCIAGPIVRYQDIRKEIYKRRFSWRELGEGMERFVIGLGKKVLLADVCADLSAQFLAENTDTMAGQPAVAVFMGMLLFMLQIYLDFSAYSDMAIGLGQMIGFHYKENFDYPYQSRSVTEFWRRWHISLGSFFRDYLYIPLGGNRHGLLVTFRNLFIVWALTGFWHGAGVNYILWGLYFFVFIALERLFHRITGWKPLPVLSNLYLLVVVFFGWILFRFEDMGTIEIVLRGLFGAGGFINLSTEILLKNNLFFLIIAIIAVTSFPRWLWEEVYERIEENAAGRVIGNILRTVFPVFVLLLSTVALIGSSYHPFLYFQF